MPVGLGSGSVTVLSDAVRARTEKCGPIRTLLRVRVLVCLAVCACVKCGRTPSVHVAEIRAKIDRMKGMYLSMGQPLTYN